MKNEKNSPLQGENCKEFTLKEWKLSKIHPLNGQKSQKITQKKKLQMNPNPNPNPNEIFMINPTHFW